MLPRGRANEALDCRVYSYAALHGLYAVRKLKLERVSEMLETIVTGAAIDAPEGELPAAPGVEAPPPPRFARRVKRSAFVG